MERFPWVKNLQEKKKVFFWKEKFTLKLSLRVNENLSKAGYQTPGIQEDKLFVRLGVDIPKLKKQRHPPNMLK